MHHPRLLTAILSGAALCLPAAGAHAGTEAFARCAAIDDDARRLECYDAASGRAKAPSPVSSPGALSAAAAPADDASSSLLGKAWALEASPDDPEFRLAFHRANYLLLARHSDNPNAMPSSPTFPATGLAEDIDHGEMKFQVSFKTRLWRSESRRWGFWAAYTQQNHWQVFNSERSRPFRETNYMPEAIFSYRADQDLGGIRWRVLNIGFAHHSNGQGGSLSRSWNRVYAEFGLERGDFALLVRPWSRLEPSGEKDDNPDITDYYGYGDVRAIYRTAGGHTLTLMGRGNPNTGKGAAQFTWSTPPLVGAFKGYFQVFSGYGESLIDYNWRQTTVGFGIALSDDL